MEAFRPHSGEKLLFFSLLSGPAMPEKTLPKSDIIAFREFFMFFYFTNSFTKSGSLVVISLPFR